MLGTLLEDGEYFDSQTNTGDQNKSSPHSSPSSYFFLHQALLY